MSFWTRGRLVGHLVPGDTVHGFLAEHSVRLFPDEMFADLLGSGRGRPSVPADVIAKVLVLLTTIMLAISRPRCRVRGWVSAAGARAASGAMS